MLILGLLCKYVLWCCGGICHQPDSFIQIGSGHTVWRMYLIFKGEDLPLFYIFVVICIYNVKDINLHLIILYYMCRINLSKKYMIFFASVQSIAYSFFSYIKKRMKLFAVMKYSFISQLSDLCNLWNLITSKKKQVHLSQKKIC